MEEVDVKIFKADKRGVDPTYATDGSAGFDLYAIEDMIIKPGDNVKVKTGLVIEVPFGYALMIYARSGIAAKTPLRLANGVGVIDSDYRGEIIVALYNDSMEDRIVYNGDRIAQIVITPYLHIEPNEVTELSDTERGEGGFGSTGMK